MAAGTRPESEIVGTKLTPEIIRHLSDKALVVLLQGDKVMRGEEDNRTVLATLTPPADLPCRAEKRIQNVLRKLPGDATERKAAPVTTGCLDYFPLALAEISRLSKAGNDQHNPGQPLHWARHKSGDHADCITRHLIERGTVDTDGQRHSAKMAWRALALLQEELEAAAGWKPASE